jgi:hypothetical protein
MTTAQTTITHSDLNVIAEQHAHREGYYQTLTETAAKHLVAQHREELGQCDGSRDDDEKTYKSLPDVYAFNGIYSRNYESKKDRGDARRNKLKRSERSKYKIGDQQFIIYPRGIITAQEAYAMGRCPIEVDDNGEVVMVGDTVWNQYVDLYAERYMNWLAWKSHEMHDHMMTAQDKRKAMYGGTKFPADMADAVREYLNECGPATFSAIFGGVPGLRAKFKKANAAQKAMDAMLDRGTTKGFGEVPFTVPKQYDVESRL